MAAEGIAGRLLACHDCDALYRYRPLGPRDKALCARCGALLYRGGGARLERVAALSLTGVICLAIANVFPLLSFGMQGLVQAATLLSGVAELYRQGYGPLAALVLAVSMGMPLLKAGAHLYLLLPLLAGRLPWQFARAFRLVEALHPWAMTEVYLLGLLVAFVKLADLATVTPGIALAAFVTQIVCAAAASTALDPHALWERIERLERQRA